MKMLRIGIDCKEILDDVEIINTWSKKNQIRGEGNERKGSNLAQITGDIFGLQGTPEKISQLDQFYMAPKEEIANPRKSFILKGAWEYVMQRTSHQNKLNSIIRVKYPVPKVSISMQETQETALFLSSHISSIVAGVIKSYSHLIPIESVVTSKKRF